MGVAEADTRAQVRGAFPVAAERAGIPEGAFPAETVATSALLTGGQATADITAGAFTWVLGLTVGMGILTGTPTRQTPGEAARPRREAPL